MARCLGCGSEEEEGEDRGQELEDIQLDGGRHAATPAAVPAVAPTLLLKGAVEPYASQQHSSV